MLNCNTGAFDKKQFIQIGCVKQRMDTQGRSWKSFQRFGALLLLCMLTLMMMILYCSNNALSIMRPITKQQFRLDQSNSNHNELEETRKKLNLKGLASSLMSQIRQISSPSNCSNTSTLFCGCKAGCGLGCQLHHHAVCLMLSYYMRIPLIHDTAAWPFGNWEDVFQPLGSNCSVNERTITVKWSWKKPVLWIPVDADFLQEIQGSHPEPFLWFIGQFLKYTMRLSWNTESVVNDFLSKLPRDSPLVGFHIRRTDKVEVDRRAYHDIGEYMIPATAYFQKFNCSVNRTVYLASDDHKLLAQAKELYPLPQWRFIGLAMNETLHTQKLRKNFGALMAILEDVLALTKCGYVVCDFSSCICRLILELISADHIDGNQRVKSLDRGYYVRLQGHFIPNRLIPRSRHE